MAVRSSTATVLWALAGFFGAGCSSSSSSTLRFSRPRLVFYNASCGANSSCPNTPGVPHFCWTDPQGWADPSPARQHMWCNLGADPGSQWGANGYSFSADAGQTWRVVKETRNLLGSTLLVDEAGEGYAYRSDGDPSKPTVSKFGWTQPDPIDFAPTADGISVTAAPGPVRFHGIPEPGVVALDGTIEQSQPTTSGNVAVRLADGSSRRAANIVWAGSPTSTSSSK